MLQKRSFGSLVTIFLTFITVLSLQKTSAIRMCDSTDCQLQLMLTNTKYYYFYVPNNHLLSNDYFVICFRTREITDLDSGQCTLDGLLNSYTCLGVTPTISNQTVTDVTMTKWSSDASLTSPNQTDQTTYASTNAVISNTQLLIDIKPLITTNKIYELYVGYVVNLRSNTTTKNGFFMTFQIYNQKSSDNLLMQRNVGCALFHYKQYKNYNLLFYGGAIRGTNETMFLNILSYLVDTNNNFPIDASTNISTVNLNVWIGITFSQSGHPAKDAIVFVSDNSSTLDMFSIYYTAPFFDVSPNIMGTDDVIHTGDSNTYNQNQNIHFYWSGASRKYETGDNNGDEAIIKKMNSTISYSIGYNPSNGAYSPAVAANKHNFHATFDFNIELAQPTLIVCLLQLLLAVILSS